jgi:hypothetical protein
VTDYNEEYPLPLTTPKGFASKQQPLQPSNLDAFGHRALRVKFAYSFGHRANLADNLIVDLGGAGQFACSSGAKNSVSAINVVERQVGFDAMRTPIRVMTCSR